MPLRPCLDCGTLSTGSRCPGHTRARQAAADQTKQATRPRPWAERQRRAAVVAHWRTVNGELCPGFRVAPHMAGATNPLTADHIDSVARGGEESGPLTVLCRECNGRKADYTG